MRESTPLVPANQTPALLLPIRLEWPVSGREQREIFAQALECTSPIGQVRVVQIDIPLEGAEQRLAHCRSCLTADELARADRYRHPITQRQFLWGRSLLRSLLGQQLGCEPIEVPLAYGPRGQPGLGPTNKAGQSTSLFGFNVSHTANVVLLALGPHTQIGIDVERQDRSVNCLALARRYFAADEVAQLESLPEEQLPRAFYRVWTQKEAFIKAVGDGLSCSLTSFSVTADPSLPAAVLRCEPPHAGYVWTTRELQMPPGYVAHLTWSSAAAATSQLPD